MRRCLAVMLALAAVAPTGCFTTPPDRSVSRFEAQLPFSSFAGEDVVQLDVYLVERPAADPCINREVWEFGDEQVLQDRKSVLADNGLRACVLGETPPDGLEALLRSERSCPNLRRLRFHVGKPAVVVLGPSAPELRFQLRQDGRTTGVDLEQAQCVLQVTTRFADDGRLALHFTPAVRHGAAAGDAPAGAGPVRHAPLGRADRAADGGVPRPGLGPDCGAEHVHRRGGAARPRRHAGPGGAPE